MEEDIKILEDYLHTLKKFSGEEIIKSDEIVKVIEYKEIQAIENLLKRYKELEEENKQYKKQFEDIKYNILVPSITEKNFIPISVIQNKIDEYKKRMEKDKDRINWVIQDRIVINVLQELLEERNK